MALWKDMVRILEEAEVSFDSGLADSEVAHIEEQYAFRFPPDLRAFLQTALPVSEGFPNWRHESRDSLLDRLQLPLEGILFDVECNGFWLPEWGTRPETLDEARQIVAGLVAAAPRLIPVFLHRMIPDHPPQEGNPVFSVHQTDIIYYGCDLRDYLIHEFLASQGHAWPIRDDVRRIEFWDIERLFKVRWARGYAVFDNRRGILPGSASPEQSG